MTMPDFIDKRELTDLVYRMREQNGWVLYV